LPADDLALLRSWRGDSAQAESGQAQPARARAVDDWDLLRLYVATVPEPVQSAEGAIGAPEGVAPIVENLRPDQGVTYVVRTADELAGAFQLLRGVHGTWLHIWLDTLQPDTHNARTLFGHASGGRDDISSGRRRSILPASDFQGGLDGLLDELGFAPFRDRVRMVKHVIKWVRESISNPIPVVEAVGEVAPTSFAPPGVATTIDSGSNA
jgi:hypothetical protein